MNKTGVLLINLGTPDAPTPEAVGRYLREFLMDGFVIDLPAPLRWFLVNVMIVPRRKYQSAAAYQKVQMTGGSPLLVHTRALAESVALELADSHTVEYAMRYGNPSIASALTKLCLEKVERIIVLPLYPQYAESSFETAVVETKRRAAELGGADLLKFLPPFYDQPEFIKAWAGRIHAEVDAEKIDHLLFSFHSVPVRHLTKFHRDSSKPSARCCTEISSANENCYRAQCFETARSIAAQLELHADDYTVSFQSRLGRANIGPLREQRILGALLRYRRGHVGQHLPQQRPVRPGSHHAVLSPPQLGGRDHLHGLGDLLRILDGPDAPPYVDQARHVRLAPRRSGP